MPKHGRNPYRRLQHIAHNVDPYDSGGAPDYLQFDPAIEAERRAAQRGLEDTASDAVIAARNARSDFRTQLRDYKVQKKRDISDSRRDLRRNLQSLRNTQQDTILDYRRGIEDISRQQKYGKEDFDRQLGVLTRAYTNLGSAQTQAASAYGVNDFGTSQASKAARAANFAEDREPLLTSLQRLGQESVIARQRALQDKTTALTRIQTAKHQARTDTHRTIKRTRKDTKHDIGLSRRDYRRTIHQLYTHLERAIREQRIGDADLIRQEIFQARQLHPNSVSNHQPTPGQLHDHHGDNSGGGGGNHGGGGGHHGGGSGSSAGGTGGPSNRRKRNNRGGRH